MNSFESPQSGRKIAYTPEAKEMVGRTPELIQKVIAIVNDPELNYKKIETDTFTIEPTNSHLLIYHKLTVGGREYFLKRQGGPDASPEDNPTHHENGFNEFHDTASIESVLADQPNVEIVHPIAGYHDGKATYFVSRWDERLTNTLDDYMAELEDEPDDTAKAAKHKELGDRTLKIEGALLAAGYSDARAFNMGYDPDTDNIIIFDITRQFEGIPLPGIKKIELPAE